MICRRTTAWFLAGLWVCVESALAQSTAVTYQGLLQDAGAPAAGPFDMRFRLFSAATGGTQVGSTLCFEGVTVVDGVFTVRLDFGQQYITTGQRHLDIQVRREIGQPCSDDFGYVLLTPRQQLTAAPFALFASQASAAFTLAAADCVPANAVFVDNNGNVGIGTTAPISPLQIARDIDPVISIQDIGPNSTQAGYLGFRNGSGAETGWVGYGSPGDPDLTILNSRAGGDIVLNPISGRVGINTGAPTALLHVAGKARFDVASPSQNLEVNNAAGSVIWRLGLNPSVAVEPKLALVSPVTGDELAGFFRGAVSGDGHMFADQKNFRAPNPADPATDIWYCCPEGPEAAMYVRGTARLNGGRAVVELPQHFRDLASEPGMTVQLTPLSAESKGLAVVKKGLDGITVAELAGGTGNYEFDWRVEAVRKGYEDYQVVRPWMRSDEDESKAWENRTKWIAERRASGKP